MEIISYISSTDGFTHYMFVNSMGLPFFLWLLLVCGSISLICSVLHRIICGGN